MTNIGDLLRLPVHQSFERQAASDPDGVAITEGVREITYGELNRRANSLAHVLRDHQIAGGATVGVFMERSIDAVAAIVAILKAGGVYVPLDPQAPPARLNDLIEDASVNIVLTGEVPFPVASTSRKVTMIDTRRPALDPATGDNLPATGGSFSPAYILYTSGSTGSPKGVIGVHRSILHNLTWAGLAEDDVCSLTASLSFGASVSTLFQPLVSGRRLVIVSQDDVRNPERFLQVIHGTGVTRTVFVTTVLEQILELGARAAGKLARLRTVGVAGATLTTTAVHEFWKLVPNATLHNGYSATEIGTLATYWEATQQSLGRGKIAIGRPVPGTTIHVLDPDRNAVEEGDCGELYVGATHLALGYLNDPDLTAERFIPDPFSSEEGARLFRTGDLGRRARDGELELVGRVDDQVKIRGFRVTLGEIEAALTSHPSVYQAAVVSGVVAGTERLIAYLVLRSDEPREDALRKYLAPMLPSYMVPSAFIVLPWLPLSANGKVDRRALRMEDGRPLLGADIRQPNDLTEHLLIKLWEELLGRRNIGVDDHFLDLGGDSLFAIRITARIEDELGVSIPVEALFDRPTVRELGALLASCSGAPRAVRAGQTE